MINKLPKAQFITPSEQSVSLIFCDDQGHLGVIQNTPSNIAQLQCMIDKAKQQDQVDWVTFEKVVKIAKAATAGLALQKSNVEALQHTMKLQNKKSKKTNNKQAKYSHLLGDSILSKCAIKGNEDVVKSMTLQLGCLYQVFQWKVKTRYTQEVAKEETRVKKAMKQQASEKVNINVNTLLHLYNTPSASPMKPTTPKTA